MLLPLGDLKCIEKSFAEEGEEKARSSGADGPVVLWAAIEKGSGSLKCEKVSVKSVTGSLAFCPYLCSLSRCVRLDGRSDRNKFVSMPPCQRARIWWLRLDQEAGQAGDQNA